MKQSDLLPSAIVSSVFSSQIETMPLDAFIPTSIHVSADSRTGEIPTSVDQLPESVSRSYDLSVTAAAELSIPVVGSVSGGMGRRVIVGERTAFKRITTNSIERHYGYAIRMCVTVNKWNADLKVNLPFLAASAQLGVVEAQWLFQVVGLAGPKIDLNLPPTKLDVETFVVAQQSLEKIVTAIRDPSTKFIVSVIAEVQPIDQVVKGLKASAVKTYGITALEKGRSLLDARKRLQPNPTEDDILSDIYKTVGGLSNPAEEPSDHVRNQARLLLGRIRADT